MFINKNWRVLTVGDGDLSFSRALTATIPTSQLECSVYDSEEVLRDKYSSHAIDDLRALGAEPRFEFDVTEPQSWQTIKPHGFDVVIFQFPLLNAINSAENFTQARRQGGLNTLNRALLHLFLRHSGKYALDPQGAGLCYITSKDVKPYSHWGLEHALTAHTKLHYLGEQQFDINRFEDYRIRNVDRDKHVKDTQGTTYTYGLGGAFAPANIERKAHLDDENFCLLCQAGPFQHAQERHAHEQGKQHQSLSHYQNLWQKWLNTRYL